MRSVTYSLTGAHSRWQPDRRPGCRAECGMVGRSAPTAACADVRATAGTARAHPGDDASREPAREPDYRLCCMPRTMRISRTPLSTWAVPSGTKPCLR